MNRHIKSSSNRTIRSLLKILIVLACFILFVHPNKLNAQVINNNGAAISVTSGTVVQGDTLENTAGKISNFGHINLNGHYINKDTTEGDGIYKLKGNWLNTGKFIPGISTVHFDGNNLQTITSGGDTLFHLIINNSGIGLTNRIVLLDNILISDSLNLSLGNVETGANTLYLKEQTSASLKYTSVSGSRVIGKFERGVNTQSENYLFPLGSSDNYNPLNLNLNAIQNTGSILSEFVSIDPDTIGLWLPDKGYLNPADSVEVYDTDSVGYWSLTANNSFASDDYNINLTGNGFRPYQNVDRILKRDAVEGIWKIEGTHSDADGSVTYRDNLKGGVSNSGNHYGWGYVRPRIQWQPEDTLVCDGDSATFRVLATGRRPLSYRWEVHQGSGGWIPITDGGTYANSNSDTLLIVAADTSMNQYKYRVIITDSLGNEKHSNAAAKLTVYPRPQVTATPQQDTICNQETTHIVLTSTEPLTSYVIEILNPTNNILGDNMTLDGDTIKDELTNPTLEADSVIYRITPYGPFTPSCAGDAIIVVVWVEPTVEITALNDTICNGDFTGIDILSENITTNGIHYTWTSSATDPDVSGYSNNIIGRDTLINITDQLINIGLDSAIVHYEITPWTLDASGNLKCEGTSINIDIWVEPTVEINAVNDTICDVTATAITVTSPNTTTNGIRYTWTVTDNPNITGESDYTGNGQLIGSDIIQILTNNSDSKQLVRYTITPWTINASSENECTDAGEVIIIDIWVEPTPQVYITVVQDTICNNTNAEILLETPTELTTGVVTFDYTSSTSDAGIGGNSSGTDLIDGTVITDLLTNSTALPARTQVARYIVIPRALSTGCVDGPIRTDSVTVHPTPDTYMFADSVRCYLESNGEASVIAENGINEFTYYWDDPFNQTDSLATGLVERRYRVTITDNQGCTKVDSVDVGQPDRLVPYFDIDSIQHESCFGFADGYAMVEPYGGNGTYYYNWSTGDNTYYTANLDGDIYAVTVTDWKGCMQDTLIQINSGLEITGTIEYSNVRCNGENNGWVNLNAPGAVSYEWYRGATSLGTTQLLTNLSPATYTVFFENSEGCGNNLSHQITEPDVLIVDSIVSANISCAGDADGTLDLFVSGGNHDILNDYIFNWFTSDGVGLVGTLEDQSGLSGGNYYVTVTDYLGCITNDSASVGEPEIFEDTIIFTDVTCFGEDDGTIDVDASGGNGEYSYSWSNGEITDTLFNLSEGEYFVTITDAKGCEIYDTVNILEPDLLDSRINKTDVTCFGYNDGTATLDINGGSGGYIINWEPSGETTDSIFGLSAGTYYVTVNDINNCVTTNFIEIFEPEAIDISMTYEDITCFGYSNGEILLDASGGVTPYSYIWSHDVGLNSNSALNLDPGSYSVSVVDNNNCMEITNVDLTQPDPLEATITKTDISCFGFNDGYIAISMFGGTPDYIYTWSDNYDAPIQDLMEPGFYDIRISDQNSCYIDTTLEIIEPEILSITPTIRRPTCADIQDGFIELNLNGGVEPYSIYWDDGSSEEDLYDIRSGIYNLYINDYNLCEIDTTFTIRSIQSFCIEIPTAFTPNNDGVNEEWVIDMGGLYPNAEVEIFDRTGNRVFYSKGYEESDYWDGTLKGDDLPMDAYYYVINLKNGASRISGVVTLIR